VTARSGPCAAGHFVINLLIETDRVELLAGDPQPVEVPRDGGSKQTIFRCPACQVAVYSQHSRPEVRFVVAAPSISRGASSLTSSEDA
jgi:hypothetical protein